VTGTIVDSSGSAPRGVCVTAEPVVRGILGWRLGGMNGTYRDDGSFVIPNLPPGQYRLIAQVCASCGADVFRYDEIAVLSVTVNGADVSGLAMATTKPKTSRLSGRIRFDGEPNPGISPGNTVVVIRPVDDAAGLTTGCDWCEVRVKDDWSFALPRLAGRWAFEGWLEHPGPTRSLEMLRVKSISEGARDVTHSSVNFSTGADPGTIEIVFGKRPSAVLTGSVDDRGRPVGVYGVIAFSVDTANWGFDRISRDVRVAHPDQNGQFRIAGLSVADYFVVALPARGLTRTFEADPKFLERLRRYATKVSMSEAQVKHVRLRLSPVVP
jgi:hypothetical protein